MDFTLDDEQQAIADLATQILDAEVTEERLREVTAGEAPFDERTWTKLAEAGLVSIVVPEADGGSGYGILEACLVLEEVGRHVVPGFTTDELDFFGATGRDLDRLLPPRGSGDVA